jgi:hypothetical protein
MHSYSINTVSKEECLLQLSEFQNCLVKNDCLNVGPEKTCKKCNQFSSVCGWKIELTNFKESCIVATDISKECNLLGPNILSVTIIILLLSEGIMSLLVEHVAINKNQGESKDIVNKIP